MSDESIWKEIETHRAISRGGWTFATGVSVALFALLPFLTSLATLLGWLSASPTDLMTRIVLGFGTIEGLALIWFVFFSSADMWPKPWLRAYWEKSVRGYVANLEVSGIGDRILRVYPRGRDASPDDIGIFLPLGGWCAKPRVTWRGKPSRWRVLPRLETDSHDWVRLYDNQGTVMVMPIGDALVILGERIARAMNEPFWNDHSDIPFTWLDILTSTREERDDGRRDRDETQRQLDEARAALATTIRKRDAEQAAHQRTREQGEIRERQLDIDRQLIADQRDAAQREAQEYRGRAVCAESQLELTRNLYDETLVFLDNLVNDFEKSDRCRTHLDSLRLRCRVLEFLRSHSPDMSPHFRHYSDERAAVSAQIHDLERRNAKRHGRKHPKAAAPAETAP